MMMMTTYTRSAGESGALIIELGGLYRHIQHQDLEMVAVTVPKLFQMHFKPKHKSFYFCLWMDTCSVMPRSCAALHRRTSEPQHRTRGHSVLGAVVQGLDKVQDPFQQGRTQTLCILMIKRFQH